MTSKWYVTLKLLTLRGQYQYDSLFTFFVSLEDFFMSMKFMRTLYNNYISQT